MVQVTKTYRSMKMKELDGFRIKETHSILVINSDHQSSNNQRIKICITLQKAKMKLDDQYLYVSNLGLQIWKLN